MSFVRKGKSSTYCPWAFKFDLKVVWLSRTGASSPLGRKKIASLTGVEDELLLMIATDEGVMIVLLEALLWLRGRFLMLDPPNLPLPDNLWGGITDLLRPNIADNSSSCAGLRSRELKFSEDWWWSAEKFLLSQVLSVCGDSCVDGGETRGVNFKCPVILWTSFGWLHESHKISALLQSTAACIWLVIKCTFPPNRYRSRSVNAFHSYFERLLNDKIIKAIIDSSSSLLLDTDI